MKYLKIIVIIVTVVAILAVGLSVLLFTFLNRERVEKSILQEELYKVMKERKTLSQEIEELKIMKTDIEKENTKLSSQYESLSAQYEIEKSQNDAVRLEINRKKDELTKANQQLRAAAQEKEKLQNILDDEKTRYDELKDKVNKLIEVKDVLEEKVRDIINRQGVELERIVVKAEGELEGKVLVVNRKYNFVVVDIGFTDNLSLGDLLTIFRDGKYVGEAQIEKIYDSMSAATIAREIKPGAIAVGDNVVVRSN
ncbi:MAG: hypothetical protein JW800_02620 [Candidatus Omnitrophica bacterium]|nr:hypothetical protein [Candidatus Omnitrophota bacterium]